MRFMVVLALTMVFAVPAKEADASAHMAGGMALSQDVNCQTSVCCRPDGKSGQRGNHDNSGSNNCGLEFNCGSSCPSLSGEIMLKEELSFGFITRLLPDYFPLLASSHLINLERPPKLLS